MKHKCIGATWKQQWMTTTVVIPASIPLVAKQIQADESTMSADTKDAYNFKK